MNFLSSSVKGHLSQFIKLSPVSIYFVLFVWSLFEWRYFWKSSLKKKSKKETKTKIKTEGMIRPKTKLQNTKAKMQKKKNLNKNN